MKKHLLQLSGLLLMAHIATAQVKTVIYKPGAAKGEDASLWNCYGVILPGYGEPVENTPNPNAVEMSYMAWTWDGNPGEQRALIRFADMDTIPAAATIVSAHLKLYGPSSTVNWGNSTFPGSPYSGTNEGWLRRVTGAWTESAVTWTTQPSFTTANQISIPASDLRWGWHRDIDVTSLIADIRTSGNNYGFILQLQDEKYYKAVHFASSDHSDPALWPELVIDYTMPTTGITGMDMAEVKIYPNPVTDILHIDGIEKDATISIYNVTGQLVQRTNRTAGKAVSLSGQATGTYILQIVSTDGHIGRIMFNKK
jgi:hypothetical protein